MKTPGKGTKKEDRPDHEPPVGHPVPDDPTKPAGLCFGRGMPNDPKLYVISVCDGIGGGLVAANEFVGEVNGLACEREDNLREFVAGKWPKIKSSKCIEDLKAENLKKDIEDSGATVLLLVGGPPCQSFTCLATGPKGFADERSAPLRQFVRLKDELTAMCTSMNIRFVWLMEEVASMSLQHREEISAMLGAEPVLLHAADFGLIHRARLYWGLDLQTLLSPESKLREMKKVELYPPGKVAEGLHVVRWCGPPVPENWKPEDGFEWRYRAEHGTTACTPPGTKFAPAYPAGRMSALTTVFPHPADRPPRGRNDPDVYQRFIDDERRRPLFQYAKGNMLWKGNQARPTTPEESEEVMGFPRGYTEGLKAPKGKCSKDARQGALGNSFHVPSIVLLLALLFNPLAPVEAAGASSFLRTRRPDRRSQDEWEAAHANGTVWEEGRERGKVDGRKLMTEAVELFEPGMIGSEMGEHVNKAAMKLDALPLASILNFEDFLEHTGAPPTATGPDIQALWCKSPMHAAVGKQHRPSVAQMAQERMIPRGVGPERHAELASQLAHPFAADAPIERDLRFAVEANVRIGLNIRRCRRRRLRVLEKIAAATAELDEHLRSRRPVSLDGVPGPAPMLVAVMVTLLRWPDRKLPQCLATGFGLAGEIIPADIYRPCIPKQVGAPVDLPLGTTLSGPTAASFVDELEADRRPHPQAQIIYDLTLAEVAEGLAEPPTDRAGMDKRFGFGGWRPLPRHVIWQAGKWRPIDDGKRSLTNAMTTVSESLVCIPPEFLLLVIRAFVSTSCSVAGTIPEWATGMKFATEDWWKGFRQLAPRAEDRGLAVVAFQDPVQGRWLYSALRGLPFGLGAAVNQFNRLPALATALARRVLYVMMGHYVDDNAGVELEQLGGSAQECFIRMMEILGVRLSPSKRQEMTCMAAFLGHIHDLSRLRTDRAIAYGPKHTTRDNMEALITQAIERFRLSSGEAAKLRGIATWLDSGLAGRCCRGAMTALTARQYWEEETWLTDNLHQCLLYLLAAARCAPDRVVRLFDEQLPPVIVYTDAADEKGQAKLGGIAYRAGHKPQALTLVAPPWLRATWGGQATVINQAELAAVPIMVASMPEVFQGRDIIWFIDNTSAESALIKAGSPTETMCRPALRAAAMLAGLGSRVWFEHVPSKDNPADVLSRDAMMDAAVKSKIETGEWILRTPVIPDVTTQADYHELWGMSVGP